MQFTALAPLPVLPLLRRAAALLVPAILVVACDELDVEDQVDDDAAGQVELRKWSKVETSVVPTLLEVYANGAGSGSGTSASLKVIYRNKSGTYQCTLSSGVPAGQWRTCVPSKVSTVVSSSYDLFYVAFTDVSSSDGLRYSSVAATLSGTRYSLDYFTPAETGPDEDFTCQGCDSWGENCGSCWLDSAGHGRCVMVELPMSTDSYDGALCKLFD